MAKNERSEWTVLGRVVGTATGWDQIDDSIIILYGYEPSAAMSVHFPIDLTAKPLDLGVDFENGWLETYADDGEVVTKVDIFEALAALPRKE